MRRLLGDERGFAGMNVLSFGVMWSGVCGIFLMNVQFGRHFIRRDFVDHATAVAADAASKIVCADPAAYGGAPRGQLGGARQAAVFQVIAPLLSQVTSSPDACALTLEDAPGVSPTSPGALPIDVALSCTFPCEIPFAANAMCTGTPPQVVFTAHQTTVAAGCDVADGS